MNKEELIQLHTLMVQMKDFLERKGKGEFPQYNSLNMNPAHVHKHKSEHKNAIIILSKEISTTLGYS